MKTQLLYGLALVVAASTLAGCGSEKKKQQQTENKAVLVKTSPATGETVEEIAEFTANIEPYEYNNISSSTPGRIDQILAEVGDNVKKGQLLAVMDKTEYNKALVQLNLAEVSLQRIKAVYEAGGATKQQVDEAEANVKVLRDALKYLKENIELRSPINGVVTARNNEPGDIFSMTPSSSGPAAILTVMQMGTLKIRANVSEQYFPKVKLGMPVEIKADLFPDQEFKGKVSLIHPAIDKATRTFTVEVTIPNGNLKLRPGMFSKATLKLGTKEGVLVEDLAVQKQAGSNEKFLFVAKDGKAERRSLTLGRTMGSRIDVIEGVKPGEEVIISGISKLNDQTPVEVKNN